MKFSLVYPTRHRPQFIEMALKFLEHQNYDDFEIVVCDNYIDPTLSCESLCNQSKLDNINYVRPPIPLDMVENWNYALQFISGDYICYFTDKMFLLPGVLKFAANILEDKPSDILNWVDNKFTAERFSDYFGQGHYRIETPGVESGAIFQEFDPLSELRKKVEAVVSRNEQSASHYARGKICFGAFSRRLVDKILIKAGKLFNDISPDYTSMILGLSYAENAIEIFKPGIVHINTDLSNGGQVATRDEIAYSYIATLSNYENIIETMLVPNLYACQHNVVSHDYIVLKNKYDLSFELNRINWLIYIFEDLDIQGRKWSSNQVFVEQKQLLNTYIANLNDEERSEFQNRLKNRLMNKRKNKYSVAIKNTIKSLVPRTLINYYKKHLSRSSHIHLNALTDILHISELEK